MTLRELIKEYSLGNSNCTEVTDKADIQILLDEKSSVIWGRGPCGKTGWYKLLHGSPARPGEKSIILVCRTTNLPKGFDQR